MKKFKIIYSIIGVVLVVLIIVTGNRTLSQKNIDLYDRAESMVEDIDNEVWSNFNIKDYPTAIRKNNTEYVFFHGNINRREAVLPVIACTSYPVDNVYNILMPCYEDMNLIGNIVEGISDGTALVKSEFGFSNNSISENEYIAFMYHEGFHAYQLSNYKDKLFNSFIDDIETYNKKDDISNMGDVISKIDKNTSLLNLYKNENKLLYNALQAESKDEVLSYIEKYIASRNKRIEILKKSLSTNDFKSLMDAEKYYELIEGTAKYVEYKTLEVLNDNDMCKKYIVGLSDIQKGDGKYYMSGMAMCLILENLDEGWKEDLLTKKGSLYDKFLVHINDI